MKQRFYSYLTLIGTCALSITVLAAPSGLASPSDVGQLGVGHSQVSGAPGVYASAVHNDTVYFGGAFDRVQPYVGSGITVDKSSALGSSPAGPNGSAVVEGGEVYSVVRDGNGGFFLGGSFKTVGGNPQANLAHINPDGSFDTTWRPVVDVPYRSSGILQLALSHGALFLVGDFSGVNHERRHNAAAIDALTASTRPWNPDASGPVNAISVVGDHAYLGGKFGKIGGIGHKYLAKVDVDNGLPSGDWDPKLDQEVEMVESGNGMLYLGGLFRKINGAKRENVGAVQLDSGKTSGWQPKIDDRVLALAVTDNRIYIGGGFKEVNGENHQSIVALDATSGKTLPWNPNIAFAGNSPNVSTITESEGVVYFSGDFRNVKGTPRYNAAAVDLSGKLTGWDPSPESYITAISVEGDRTFLGGGFRRAGGVNRFNAAAINLKTRTVTSWNPHVDDVVNSMAYSDGDIFLAGEFTQVKGAKRPGIASVDTQIGLPTKWNTNTNIAANEDATVGVVAAANDRVYFTRTIHHEERTRQVLHALDSKSGKGMGFRGAVTNEEGELSAIFADGETIYIGGDFTRIGSSKRKNLVALDATSGRVKPWKINANSSVTALAESGGVLYVSGYFDRIGDQSRSGLGAIDLSENEITKWNPHLTTNNIDAPTLLPTKRSVYVSEVLTATEQSHTLLAVTAKSGNATNWNPSLSGSIKQLARVNDALFVGGAYISGNGIPSNSFAVISSITGRPIPITKY